MTALILSLAGFYVFCVLYEQFTNQSFVKKNVALPIAGHLLKAGHVKLAMQVRNFFR